MQHVQHTIHVEIWDGLASGQIYAGWLALLAVDGTAPCCAEGSDGPWAALAVLSLLLLFKGLLRLGLLAAPGAVGCSISGPCCV
jgi:hypothetical protein